MDAKRVAAVAGVLRYLARQVEVEKTSPAPPAASSGPGPWALYGRQAQMNQRIRMQARRRA
jgi:hypothetical protein